MAFLVTRRELQSSYQEIRGLNKGDMPEMERVFHISFDKSRLSTTKFMEWKDFDLVYATTEDIEFLNKKKLKLDSLTGRDYIENEWNNSEFGVKEQSQFILCYNFLLHTFLFVD